MIKYSACITRFASNPRRTKSCRQVRVVGGAYGGFCRFDPRSGDFKYLSYRDPNLGQTLDTYDGAPGVCELRGRDGPNCSPGPCFSGDRTPDISRCAGTHRNTYALNTCIYLFNFFDVYLSNVLIHESMHLAMGHHQPNK